MTCPVGFHHRRMDPASQAQASPLGFVVLESGCPPLHKFASATSGGEQADVNAPLRSSQLRGTGKAENFAVLALSPGCGTWSYPVFLFSYMLPAIGATCFPGKSRDSEEASFLSVHQCIHPPFHSPSVYLYIHLSIHMSTHASIYPSSTYSLIYLPTHPPTHLSMHPSIHTSTHPHLSSSTYLPSYPPVHLCIYPSLHPSSKRQPTHLPIHSSHHQSIHP